MEKISIIIPVFKVEEYLDKCIESIIAQTYKNIEVILVDDGSPDTCPQMCDAWAKKDSRIRVVHKKNGGLADARNAGMQQMSGQYFMFADSDDWMEPDMISFLYTLITEYDADMARCGFYFNYEAENREENLFSQNAGTICMEYNEQLADLVVGGHVSGVVWNKLYKTETLGDIRFDKADGCAEDIMFNYRALRKNIKTAYLDAAKYHYVLRDNSITNSEFTENALSIVYAKKNIMEGEQGNKQLSPYLIQGYVTSCYAILSGIIKNKKCLDKYDYLRNEILKYKTEIFVSSLYSAKDKIKTFILFCSKFLFNKLIERKI